MNSQKGMVMQNPPKESIFIEPDDLKTFKTIVLLFLITRIVGFAINFATIFPIISILRILIIEIGTLVLAIGIIKLARKYPKLESGVKVGLLFVLAAVIDFASTSFTIFYPAPSMTVGATQEYVNTVINYLNSIYIYISILSILSGIAIVLSAYYFTNWVNLGFGEYSPTKSFLYYGVLTFVGNLISISGEYFVLQSLSTLNISTGITSTQNLTPIIFGGLASIVGLLFVLAGFIYLIIACVKIYNRVDDKFLGRTPFNKPGAPFQTPYQQNYPQPPQMGGSQYGTSNPVSSDQQTFNQPPSMNSATNTPTQTPSGNIFCSMCGAQVQPGNKFCQNCGNKLQ